MSHRLPVDLRRAVVADAPGLVALWRECAEASSEEGSEALTPQALWQTPSLDEATGALERNLSVPGRRIIVAEHDGEIVGATVCDVHTLTPISPTRTLVVSEIQVAPRFRRRSVAATLLSSVAAYGEEQDCEIVLAAVPSDAREPNRYLAKIGFGQIAVLRGMHAHRLRSRLSAKAASTPETGRLLAVRRSLRRRAAVR